MTLEFIFQMTPEMKRTVDRLARRTSRAAVYDFLDGVFQEEAESAAEHIRKTQFGGFGDSSTGLLKRSVKGQSSRFRRVPRIEVGVFSGDAVVYAGIQEFGTFDESSPFDTIHPVNARALAVPVLGTGGEQFSSPREFPDELTLLPVGQGRVVARLVRTSDLEAVADGDMDFESVTAVYILVTAVDLPEKLYLTTGMEEYFPTMVSNIQDALEEYLEDQVGA